MVAFVTSTLYPSSAHSFFSNDERYDQTLHTITRLREVGFEQIFLFDNSIKPVDVNGIKDASGAILQVYQNSQYTFSNKGLNEALLILNTIHHLPSDTLLFKISARYAPTKEFSVVPESELKQLDFAGVGYDFGKKVPVFNTRAYYVKNKAVLETSLVLAIEEMLSYAKGIHGPKSLINAISRSELGCAYQLSIENALGRIIRLKLNYKLLNKIGIEGYVAGAQKLDYVTE